MASAFDAQGLLSIGAVSGAAPTLLASRLPSLQGAVRDIRVDGELLLPSAAQASPSVGAQLCGDASAASACTAAPEATIVTGTGSGSFSLVGAGDFAYWRSDGAGAGAVSGGTTFTVPAAWPAGQYQVSLSYESLGSASASNALLRLIPAAGATAGGQTYYVNQRAEPAGGSMDEAGRAFTAPFLATLSGGARIVVSATGADGVVTARAVRLQRLGSDGCLA